MDKTATKIRDLHNFRGTAALYCLSEPFDGRGYAVVSRVGVETVAFATHGDAVLHPRTLTVIARAETPESPERMFAEAGYLVSPE